MTAKPKILEALYRSTTPIFMAGADATKTAEVRLSGIKGILRFWWRAQAWMRWPDMETIRAHEAAIFGDTNAQSPAIFHLAPYDETCLPAGYRYQLENPENGQNGEGLLYIGQGLAERADDGDNYKVRRGARTTELRLTRACLPSQLMITLKILVRPCENQDFIVQELERTLQLAGLIGGIGARTRRGFGSLTLIDLKGGEKPWEAPVTIDELRARLAEFKLFGTDTDTNTADPQDSELPPYTAFSPQSRMLFLQGIDGERPLEMLDRLGKEMIRYRSWGTRGSVLGGRAEKNFRKDHNLMLTALHGRRVSMYPDRIVFGLPQAYFFSSVRAGTTVSLSGHGMGQGTDRRASPLMFHVHQRDENTPPIAILTFLPAPFIASDDTILIGKSNRVKFKTDHGGDFWQPIHGYLDRLQDAEQSVEAFPTVRELRAERAERE